MKSDSDNYITVQFNEYTTYDSGFKIESCTSRNDIRYIDSLENFFNGELDPNSKKIIWIDLSHFIS